MAPDLAWTLQAKDKNATVQPQHVRTPLEKFFSQYPKFRHQPLNSPVDEFNRLCREYGWGKGGSKKKSNPKKKDDPKKGVDPEKAAARRNFQTAMQKEFKRLYGSDEKDINNWHSLCHVLKINPVPDTLPGCRAVVLEKHVNLVDLVHGDKMEVRIFETEKELSEYTRAEEKFFPKENARDGGVLRALRRHILAPREDRRVMGRGVPGRNWRRKGSLGGANKTGVARTRSREKTANFFKVGGHG
ncbi:hypothetical protein BJV74DRAFT_846098 [Russula compacta]|nr:hypothetical protein BJV74DRAFT_846098 [Russula compacta]